MGKSVIITGGAGYLGSRLTEILLHAGYSVNAVDNLMYEQSFNDYKSMFRKFGNKYTFHLVDLRNTNSIEALITSIDSVDAIMHFGDLSSVYACNHNPVLTQEVSRQATSQLIELAFRSRIPVIYNSSSSLYGASKDYREWTEDDELPPLSDLYCEAKWFIESEIIRLSSLYAEASYNIFRPATVFGQSPRFRIELLPNHFTYSAISRGRIRVSDANSNRAFISANTLCAIYHRVLDERLFKNRIYNVGSYNLSKLEISAEIQRHVPCKIVSSDETGDPRDLRIDCKRFNDELFKIPPVDLQEEIHSLAQFLKESMPIIEGTQYRSLLNMPLELWRSLI